MVIQMRETYTIFGQLQNIFGINVEPAPDEWDRLYNVDFMIEVNGKYIGIQLKSITSEQTFDNCDWRSYLGTSCCKFQKKFGGMIFIIAFVMMGKRKLIYNFEVIPTIRKEIERLKNEP
ncbi:MAG: MjaI family restriction endonuclease [candidate division KSB1 bacterium]|nr:MjaI family restriction endonuclease [candidate division KSB1 bacterium]